jgi:3-hydroxybutyryl-CoA dehydrogenase
VGEAVTPDPGIERVGVIGAGAMGHGIAQVAAMAGYEVRIYDVEERFLERALKRIRSNLDEGVERGKVESGARDAALQRITLTVHLGEAAAGADMVIEAVPEDLMLKREIFRELEGATPDDAVLATNTSSLSVTRIAEAVTDPSRFVGMHFFNPVHIMKLLEIVRGERTSDETIVRAKAAGLAMRKVPIVVKDSPGFASSRLGVILGLEAMRMLEEGVASAEAIDTAMELGYRHPMGPLRLSDIVGLDVRLSIAEYLHRELDDGRFAPPPILRRKVEEGKLGRKTGQGFYTWDNED